MHLENIKASNFKNYEDVELEFSEQINCFVGDNGSGKTNLLDAIHYLSLTKSAFNPIDAQSVRHGCDFFMIKGDFTLNGKKETILCNYQQGQKKTVKRNGKPYEKLSEHIGSFPAVIIAPDDQAIIREGGETRRRFFDGLLSQIDRQYLENLIRYHRALRQRNALLKIFSEKNYLDRDLLEPYDRELALTGADIYEARKAFSSIFIPILNRIYAEISGGREETGMTYISDLDRGGFNDRFKDELQKDLALQRTASGVHRDDFEFLIDGFPLKKFGSQGQQKSFVIALKLAQFEALKTAKGFKPILLMDDIFDKLDDARIGTLMEMAAGKAFGQLFITDARPERTYQIFENIPGDRKIIKISKGRANFE